MCHRHGHDGHVAVRETARRSGRYQVPRDVPRYGSRARRQEVSRRNVGRSVPVGSGADRAENAAEPTRERQRVPGPLPVFGGPVVRGQAHEKRPTDYEIELEWIDRDISELEDGALAT